MRDTLFTRVETNEYPSGLQDRGFSGRQPLFFLKGTTWVLSYFVTLLDFYYLYSNTRLPSFL